MYIRYIQIGVEQKDSDGWGEILVVCSKFTQSLTERDSYLYNRTSSHFCTILKKNVKWCTIILKISRK